MRKLAALLLLASAPFVSGCFDIEQTLTLEKNLSGKAGFTMKVDMEPMIGFVAQMKRAMEGKEGPPTAAEIADARKEMLAQSKSDTPADMAKDRKELEQSLPKGITLIDLTVKEEPLKVAANLLFGFDNISKLSQIKLPQKDGAGPGESNPVDTPFDGLKIVDEGATILITSKPQNPMADAKSEMPPTVDPAMAKQMEDMFKGLRVAFKITAPFTIVEHNAHRKEGNTLIWEFNLTSLSKLTPAQLEQGIRVRYKK
jgi:hypothetical protein